MWEEFVRSASDLSGSGRYSKSTQWAALAFWAAVGWTAVLYLFSYFGAAFGFLPPEDGSVFNTVMKCAVVLVPILLLACVVMLVKDDAANLIVAMVSRLSLLPDILGRYSTIALEKLRPLVAYFATTGTGAQRVASSFPDSASAPVSGSAMVQRLKQLEEENAKLWNRLTSLSRDMETLQDALHRKA
jgi:hypothetical protein